MSQHGCAVSVPVQVFAALASAYYERWGLDVALCDDQGQPLHGPPRFLVARDPAALVRHMSEECLRWGEPSITLHDDMLYWAVPVMCNARSQGAVVARCPEPRLFPQVGAPPSLDLRLACAHLRELAELHNLTNAAVLAEQRRRYRREQERAYHLHDGKRGGPLAIQEVYLREEPALLSAIRRGQRAEATTILNRILLLIYQRGGDLDTGSGLELVKSLLMELVAAMCRTAVEAGAAADGLLGSSYSAFAALAAVEDEEELAGWVVGILQRVFDVIAHTGGGPPARLQAILEHMRGHLDQPLSRDHVAQAVGLSPTHVSRLLLHHTGQGFTEAFNRMRIDRAAELLRTSQHSVMEIGRSLGFDDPSYFTKVFRRHVGMSPVGYRRSGSRI